ncbi:MAG: helix-turn-helix domain-containing protein, partial [Promethearchaeota archaeon]
KPYTAPKRQIIKSKNTAELEIVSDYAKRVRNARNKLGLNQDQFAQKLNEKPSLVRRIETGKAEPTVELAKKIQKIYKIQLLAKSDEMDFNLQENKFMKKPSSSSLGDIAFIKKKKNDLDS